MLDPNNYMYMYKIVRYLHKPLDSLAILQDLPRVRKPAQLLTALDQHRDEAREHDADLEDVCPHDRLHPSLQWRHHQCTTGLGACIVWLH